MSEPDIRDRSVQILQLSDVCLSLLKTTAAQTVGEASDYQRSDLLNCCERWNLDPSVVDELDEALQAVGLQLKP